MKIPIIVDPLNLTLVRRKLDTNFGVYDPGFIYDYVKYKEIIDTICFIQSIRRIDSFCGEFILSL
jgi:hypothetical protein